MATVDNVTNSMWKELRTSTVLQLFQSV